jgi:hypothetical protein
VAGLPSSTHPQRIGVAVSHLSVANHLEEELGGADLDPQTVTSPTEAGASGLVG